MPNRRRQLDLSKLTVHQDDETHASISELAKRVHYAPSHLRALYRMAMREPLGRARRRQRLDAAAARLAQGPTQLTSLAYATGFASLEAFNHAFNRRFGRAPSQFAISPLPATPAFRVFAIGVSLARHVAQLGVRVP